LGSREASLELGPAVLDVADQHQRFADESDRRQDDATTDDQVGEPLRASLDMPTRNRVTATIRTRMWGYLAPSVALGPIMPIIARQLDAIGWHFPRVPPRRPSCRRRARIDECVKRPNLSVGEERDVHAGQDRRGSGRAGLPAQAAKVVNHVCGTDEAEREARRGVVEDAPDPLGDGCLAYALSVRVIERTLLGVQLRDGAPAAAWVVLAEDLGHVSLHQFSERGRRGAHDSHGGE
jgi:hypothetical protein